MAAVQVQSVGWWHERLADWMIANPDKMLKDAAKFFNCSQGWISILKNSDCFKEYWARRSAEASDMNSASTLIAKTGALAELALDRLLEKMETPSEALQAPFLLQTADTALRRLGYGQPKPAPGQQPGGGNVTVNIGLVSPERLAAAREKMKRLHGVTVEEIVPSPLPSHPPAVASPVEDTLEASPSYGEFFPPSKAVRSVG